jgi:hypothetical protein
MEIGEAIVAGEPFRSIAERFGKSIPAVSRHKNRCMKDKLVPAVRAEERLLEIRRKTAEGDLIEDLVELRKMAREIALKNEEAGRHGITLKAIREEARLLELEARMSGKLVPPELPSSYPPMIVVNTRPDVRVLPSQTTSKATNVIDVSTSDHIE